MDTPFGRPDVGARIEVSQRPLILPAEPLALIALPVHSRYDISVPVTPVISIEEAIAEKLARYRRTSLARDLYDLAWFSGRPLDEALVRRLWVIKVYFDVVDDGRGQPPLAATDVLAGRDPRAFVGEDIGYLTQPVDIEAWITLVRDRYQFLTALTPEEARWAACHAGHRHELLAAIERLGRTNL